MPTISNEEIRAFGTEIDACIQRRPGGGVQIDTSAIRAAVRKRHAVAERYVELTCMAATTNPAIIQSAMLIATAYQVEFDDLSLTQKVLETAKATGGETWLQRMGAPKRPDEYVPIDQRPQRQAAKAWWRSNTKQEALCDNCNRRLLRGEGFVIEGRVCVVGDRRINMGEELVCEKCFREIG
jgi:hypothetical protein